jgi:hypothetical protein
VTQAEIARTIGARDRSAVSQWESGVNVPDGMPWERLAALGEGRCSPTRARDCRGRGTGRHPRATVGATVATILNELWDIATKDALSRHYGERDGDWAPAVVARRGLGDERRLELAHGQPFDLGQSLVPQLPLTLLDAMAEAL